MSTLSEDSRLALLADFHELMAGSAPPGADSGGHAVAGLTVGH
jgi:hypothetical protein